MCIVCGIESQNRYCSMKCRNRYYYQGGRNPLYSRTRNTCMEHASETDIQKFCDRFIDTGDCWEWVGSINPAGHGQWHPHAGHGMNHAHRAAYELFVGRIKKGYVIDHLCKNRRCVNPKHLEMVTQLENLRRGKKRGRKPKIISSLV